MICGKLLRDDQDEVQCIQSEKGLHGLQKACTKRKDTCSFFVGQKLHKKCRRDYTNEKSIKSDLKRKTCGEQSEAHSPVKLRSTADNPFDFQKDCFLCGRPAVRDRQKHVNHEIFAVRSFDCEQNFRKKMSGKR